MRAYPNSPLGDVCGSPIVSEQAGRQANPLREPALTVSQKRKDQVWGLLSCFAETLVSWCV